MVRGVVDLSRALGLTTVAEGVEDAEQLALLDELGCHSVQGYLFAKPMPAEAVPAALERLRRQPVPMNVHAPLSA
jgi:EAL domain-containing protein (putative c-di-GMP-specific phosphodiesterase class I)